MCAGRSDRCVQIRPRSSETACPFRTPCSVPAFKIMVLPNGRFGFADDARGTTAGGAGSGAVFKSDSYRLSRFPVTARTSCTCAARRFLPQRDVFAINGEHCAHAVEPAADRDKGRAHLKQCGAVTSEGSPGPRRTSALSALPKSAMAKRGQHKRQRRPRLQTRYGLSPALPRPTTPIPNPLNSLRY